MEVNLLSSSKTLKQASAETRDDTEEPKATLSWLDPTDIYRTCHLTTEQEITRAFK